MTGGQEDQAARSRSFRTQRDTLKEVRGGAVGGKGDQEVRMWQSVAARSVARGVSGKGAAGAARQQGAVSGS